MGTSITSSNGKSVIDINGQIIEVNKKDIFINGAKVNKENLTYKESHYGKALVLGILLGGLLSKLFLILQL